MENMLGKMRDEGTTLLSDTSEDVRQKERPLPSSPSRGKGFQNFGNSFDVGSKRSSQTRRGASAKPRQEEDVVEILDEESGADELLLRPVKQKAAKGKDIDEEGVVVKGEFHRYHPDYPKKKLPDFKKKKKTDEGGSGAGTSKPVAPSGVIASQASTEKVRAPSRPPTPPLPRPPPRKDKSSRLTPKPLQELADGTLDSPTTSSSSSLQAKEPRRNPAPLRDITSNKRRSDSPVLVHSSEDKDETDTPRPSRPRPRPAYKVKEGQAKETKAQEPQVFPLMSPLSSDKGKGRDFGDRDATASVKKFPLPPPLTDENESQTKSKSKAKGMGKEQTNPITALSPLSTPVAHSRITKSRSQQVMQDFPAMSPLSSPATKQESQPRRTRVATSSWSSMKSKRNCRTILTSTDDSDSNPDDNSEEDGLSHKCAPFPMQTQLLESIGRSPTANHAYVDGSDEADEEEARRHRKKMRENPDLILAELMRSDDMSDDDDSFFLDPNVDPASLCPWCDEKLPPVPTPHLSAMITTARHASSPDARPTNPLGLRAPLGAFVAVCQRHRFESHHVPLAQQKGWPMEITWELINARVEAQRARLQKIVQDVDERFLPGAPRVDGDEDENGDEELPSRSRMNSVFWKDVVKSVRMKGSRQTAGVRGQFASFSKTQPGYYGELGYFIIHQTIYNLFPPTSFDPDSALPLTPTDFIQLILVPEAAVELIMEDMNQSRTDAIETLRESAEYGVAMFPDDHSDGAAAVEAGDQLVMERAMARRKELEEEERLEDELWKAREGSENNKKGKTRGRAKGKARAKESEAGEQDLAGYDDDGNAKKGCRKRSRMTRGQSSGDRSEKDLDVIMLTDSADSCSEKQVKATSKRGRSNGSKFKCRTDRRMGSSDADMNVDTDGPVDSSNPQARPRPRPRPRAREPDTHLDKGEESENIHSSQEILRPVTRGHRGKTHIPPAKDEVIDIDATPKPKKRSRSPSEPRTTRDEDKAKHSLFPLQAARDRLKGTKRPNRRDEADLEMWSRQMTDPATSTDESAYSDTSVASKYSHHPTRHSPKPAEDNYHWLLSDPSTPSTSQSR